MKFPKLLNSMAKFVKEKITKRKLIIALIVIVIIIGFAVVRGRSSNTNIETSEVSLGSLNDTITASARVEAGTFANLSFLTSGKLSWVGVKEGDSVYRGQVVASLDRKELELQLRKLLNNFEREFTDFDDSNYSVRDEVLTEEIRRIKKRAQIDLNQTVLDVEIHDTAIKLSNLISPISGIMTDVNPSVSGINITPASSKFTVVDPRSVYLRADVNEVDITKVKIGQKVLIKLDAYPNEEIESTVKSIGFESVQTSTGGTAFVVKISLPQNVTLRYKLGMKADVEFVLAEKKDIILVPATALVTEQNKSFVWTVENGKTKKVEVKTGISSIDQTEIVSGVQKDQVIITSPGVNIKEGLTVKN